MSQTKLEEWHFDFGLCGTNGNMVPESDCDHLLDMVIDWAEEHGYCIGGGFRPFSDADI